MSNLNDHTRYKVIINGEREVLAHMEGGLLKFDDSEEAKILHTANTQRFQYSGFQVNGRGHVRTLSPYRCGLPSPELSRNTATICEHVSVK